MKPVLFLITLVGFVAAGSSSEEAWRKSEEDKNNIFMRIPQAYQELGQCIIFDSMINTTQSDSVTKNCVEGSPLQSLLPSLYISTSVKPTECMEEHMEQLQSKPEIAESFEAIWMEFMSKKHSKREVCVFFESFLIPAVCDFQKLCPGKEDRRAGQAVLAVAYSNQQFLNNGMDTKFNCKKAKISINPELYKLGTKFNPAMKFLTKDIDCSRFGPSPFSPDLTTKKPTTTTTQKTTTTTKEGEFVWTWEDESKSSDEDTTQEEEVYETQFRRSPKFSA